MQGKKIDVAEVYTTSGYIVFAVTVIIAVVAIGVLCQHYTDIWSRGAICVGGVLLTYFVIMFLQAIHAVVWLLLAKCFHCSGYYFNFDPEDIDHE